MAHQQLLIFSCSDIKEQIPFSNIIITRYCSHLAHPVQAEVELGGAPAPCAVLHPLPQPRHQLPVSHVRGEAVQAAGRGGLLRGHPPGDTAVEEGMRRIEKRLVKSFYI